MSNPVTVIAPIKLAPGKTEKDLLAASAIFQREFVDLEPGVIRRELVRKPDGTYLEHFSEVEAVDLTIYVGAQGYGLQCCNVCGSPLTTTHNGEVLQVTPGCVNGEPDIEIGQHIFVGSKANWEVIPDGVTQFEEWPTENA